MINLVLRSGAKMPAIGFGTFIGGKNAPDAYQVNFEHQSLFQTGFRPLLQPWRAAIVISILLRCTVPKSMSAKQSKIREYHVRKFS